MANQRRLTSARAGAPLLHDDLGSLTRAAGAELGGDLLPHPRGDGPKRLGIGRLRPRHHDRPAAVGGLSDLDVERDLAEELHTQALGLAAGPRSEEQTSELQSLMRTSYAVFCLKKNKI